MRQQWADYRVFWRQFRDAYHSTGAVLPSGPALCAALSRFVRDGEAAYGEAASAAVQNGAATSSGSARPRHILEVGPGTGAVTTHIVRSLHPTDRLDLIERNEQFVAHLRNRLEEIPEFDPARDRIHLIHGSVEDLPENEPYDLIISGLPLNNFSVELVDRILTKLRRLLAADGTLSFFEYVAIRRAKAIISSPSERQRLRGIEGILSDLLNSAEFRRDLVMTNVPPAWVHHVRSGDWGLGAGGAEP